MSETEIRISDIQGAGHTSPLVGQTVENVRGIVTAVDRNGFYLQDPVEDGNEATSEGIFVVSPAAVAVGDMVAVSGTVVEFQPEDRLTDLTVTHIAVEPTVTVLSSGHALPAPVVIGAAGRTPPTEIIDDDGFANFDPSQDGLDFYESLEGMRVTVADPLVVSPTNRFDETWVVADRGENATGLGDRAVLVTTAADFQPERLQIQLDADLLPVELTPVEVGAELSDVTGVMGYSFSTFEINATEPFTTAPSTLAPEVSLLTPTDSQLTVASYNVLLLDPKAEAPELVDNDGPFFNVDDDVADGRFQAITAQIVNNLNTPDIIGLQEIEDNDGGEISDVTAANETLQRLVDEIAAISNVNYAFIDHPFIGNRTSGGGSGSNIRTAFLYNRDRVALVPGSVQTVVEPQDQQTNPENPFFDSRLPLVATFRFNGEEITVINNHFTAKFGSSPLFGQLQPATERLEDPAVNGQVEERRAQAQAVKDFVDRLETEVIVLGDLNEFAFVSPLEILQGGEEPVLTNLTDTLPLGDRYTSSFRGRGDVLDHILVSNALARKAEYDAVHVNVEFLDSPSDHEPVIARLFFDAGTPGDDVLVGTASDEVFLANAGNDVVAGGLGNDEIHGGASEDVLRGDLNRRSPGGEVGGDDTLFGGTGSDRLGGKGGNDKLFGEAGDDWLWGDDGDDLLRGGAGNDTLTGDNFSGGQGSDTFVLAAGGGTDTITDFAVGEDAIALDNLEFYQLTISTSTDGTEIRFGEEVLAILIGVVTLTEASFVSW